MALDATMSRQPAWDSAARLMSRMFGAVAGTGSLDVQLVYFRGVAQCVASRWFDDARSLTTVMSGVTCRAGETQIERVLTHARKENARQKVSALVLVSDSCEEDPAALYAAARQLGSVPVFMFQEGRDARVGTIYGTIADLTKGAHCIFDSSAAARLADLLRAVAAFAAGGVTALSSQNSEAAKLLLTQIRK
jgi:hypothetical protein